MEPNGDKEKKQSRKEKASERFFEIWNMFVDDKQSFRETLGDIIDVTLGIPWNGYRKSDTDMKGKRNVLWQVFRSYLNPGMERLFTTPSHCVLLYTVIIAGALVFPLAHLFDIYITEVAWLDGFPVWFQSGTIVLFLSLFLLVYYIDVIRDIRKRKKLALELEEKALFLDGLEQRIIRNAVNGIVRLIPWHPDFRKLFKQEVLRTFLELEKGGIPIGDPGDGAPLSQQDRIKAIERLLNELSGHRDPFHEELDIDLGDLEEPYEGNIDTIGAFSPDFLEKDDVQELPPDDVDELPPEEEPRVEEIIAGKNGEVTRRVLHEGTPGRPRITLKGFSNERIEEMHGAGEGEKIVNRNERLFLDPGDEEDVDFELTPDMLVEEGPGVPRNDSGEGERMVEDPESFRADPERDLPAEPGGDPGERGR